MMRKFVLSTLVVALFAGLALAQDKRKDKKPRQRPKGIGGVVVSYSEGKLTIKKRNGDEASFDISKDTPVNIRKGRSKPQKLTGDDAAKALAGLKAGSRVFLASDDEGKTIKSVNIMQGGRRPMRDKRGADKKTADK